MENASKALLIAGGVLLAMMILAIMVYVFGSMSDFAESQDRTAATQEIVEFNKGYEAYNKQRMYGTDVISVVNKAINHNKNVAPNAEDPYYVNVKMHVIQSFETTGKRIDNTKSANQLGYEKDLDIGAIRSELSSVTVSTSELKAGSSYDLGKWKGDVLEMNSGIISFFTQTDSDTIKTKGQYTYYIYSALTNFKSSIFECSEVHYNQETGRIDEISFEQIDTN